MNVLYLIRHGQASFGTAHYDQLSERGFEQSRITGEWFKQCGIQIDHAVAGGLQRHVQTAETFLSGYCGSSGWQSPIHRDPEFNEVDQIDMLNPNNAETKVGPKRDGTAKMTFDQFKENLTAAYFRWTCGLYDREYKLPYPLYAARCATAIQRAVGLAQEGETVAAFSSGGTIAMICRDVMLLGDQTTSDLMWLISNTSVSKLNCEDGKFTLTMFNSLAHLEQLADPALITLT